MIKKILIFVFLLLVFFFAFLAFFTFVNRGGVSLPIFLTKPTPTPSPILLPVEEFTASPSAYATDEAVLKIEKDLGTLEKDLDAVDLEELRLSPPLLDLSVDY